MATAKERKGNMFAALDDDDEVETQPQKAPQKKVQKTQERPKTKDETKRPPK